MYYRMTEMDLEHALLYNHILTVGKRSFVVTRKNWIKFEEGRKGGRKKKRRRKKRMRGKEIGDGL